MRLCAVFFREPFYPRDPEIRDDASTGIAHGSLALIATRRIGY